MVAEIVRRNRERADAGQPALLDLDRVDSLVFMLRSVPADGAAFRVGDDYREEDRSDPSYPNDFEMSVLQTQAGFAEIRLRYADARPDPSMRPWAQSTNWKSPDLRIRNGKSANDVPWEGHDNWIDATVRNTGRDTACNVEVSFAVKDFTLASGAETSLDSVTVPRLDAGDEVVVSSPKAWRPPPLSLIPFLTVRQHYCVVARITPQADEITRDNNEARIAQAEFLGGYSAAPAISDWVEVE